MINPINAAGGFVTGFTGGVAFSALLYKRYLECRNIGKALREVNDAHFNVHQHIWSSRMDGESACKLILSQENEIKRLDHEYGRKCSGLFAKSFQSIYKDE